MILFASGIQIYWSIFKLRYNDSKHAIEGNEPDEDDANVGIIKILCWYFGAIIGSILAVYLVVVLPKQKIYVNYSINDTLPSIQ